jgi:hypothetical protein
MWALLTPRLVARFVACFLSAASSAGTVETSSSSVAGAGAGAGTVSVTVVLPDVPFFVRGAMVVGEGEIENEPNVPTAKNKSRKKIPHLLVC